MEKTITAMTGSIEKKCSLILLSLLLAACTGIKNLPTNDKLYTGSEITLESANKINRKDKLFIKNILKNAVRPKPNKAYLGIRPKLWMFGYAGENPKSKFKKWLKDKGEAPVLMSSVKPEVTSAIVDSRIFNIGFFKGSTEFKIIEKKYTAKVIFTSHIHEQYTVNELQYFITDDTISHLILAEKEKSLIKQGNEYNLDILKNERIRIDDFLKNKGFYYFNPDYLLFKADTSTAYHTATLKLTLKDSLPKNALTVFRINNVVIEQDYSLNGEIGGHMKDTIRYKEVVFLENESDKNIRPDILLRSVYLRKNETYSRKNYNITLNRLMSMGNFKFVQIKFSESDTIAAGFLDVTILMTPMPKHTFREEIEIVSKSNNYTGPRMNLSVLSRNAFKGAELLNLNMAGSFEGQVSGKNKSLFSYSWNPTVELIFPLFLVPFKVDTKKSIYVPKTQIFLSYNYLKRVGYFDMSTFQFIYGYKWKKDIRQEHELNPINVSYTSIRNKSTLFTDLLASNPFLKKSYEEQFIASGSYSYTYNEQVIPGKKVQYFLHVTSELAGNIFSLTKLISGEKISQDHPSIIVGSIYSQYARLSIDGRIYCNFTYKKRLTIRIFAGAAKPYGNSSTLPYSKQFFSGGPNSVRSFQINSVGPGTYHQNTGNIGFLQLGGDVKLEMNAEYRFTIFRFLKGAIFADAGNVWLLKSNPSYSGSLFSFSGFTDDLAVGAGVGLRIDVSFFILRFDLATPLRKPWLETNHRWVTNQINFGNSVWRKENLILNVAIGYPF